MIFFRADGNQTTGSGHVMRCLSLASAFRGIGEECRFVMSDDSFASAVRKNGFSAEILNTDYTRMEDELSELSLLSDRLHPSQMIVDGYYVTGTYLSELRKLCSVVYIDDLAAFAYPVDCLVNYNIFGRYPVYEKLYQDAGISLPRLFLGPEYVPLREEFKQVKKRPQPFKVHDVLISTGGADSLHLTLHCLRFLKESGGAYDDFCFHFVVGALNADAEKIMIAAEGLRNAAIHKNVTRMGHFMQQCDIAVAAAGSTLYELCACGIPTITYILADNQRPGAEAFKEQGFMISVGDIREMISAPETIFRAVRALSDDMEGRGAMSAKMQEAVDACGADRLAAALLSMAGKESTAEKRAAAERKVP